MFTVTDMSNVEERFLGTVPVPGVEVMQQNLHLSQETCLTLYEVYI